MHILYDLLHAKKCLNAALTHRAQKGPRTYMDSVAPYQSVQMYLHSLIMHSLISELHCLLISQCNPSLKNWFSIDLRSDCTGLIVMSDLELHCLHVTLGPFLLDTSHVNVVAPDQLNNC